MEVVDDIRNALPEIARLLQSVGESASVPDTPQKQAIRAVWSAVDHTRMHLAKVRRDDHQEGQSNPELVGLWSEASLQVAAFDDELAERLRLKAEYWSDPQYWNAASVAEAGIQIEVIATRARELLQIAVPTPTLQGERKNANSADFFVSHASEDKHQVARPLAAALVQRGYTVWYDDFALRLGDNLQAEIDRGLGACQYGVIILSPSFIAKPWPKLELQGLLALETGDGRKRILPVWHRIEQSAVAAYSPILASRVAVSTDLGIDEVADQIVRAHAA